MHEIAKIESQDIRSKVKLYPDVDWDEEIDNLKFYLIENDEKIGVLEKDIFEKRATLKDLNIQMALSDSPDIVTESEFSAQEEIVSRYKKEIDALSGKEKEINHEIALKQKRYSKIEQVKSDFSIRSLQIKLEIQKDLDRAVIDLSHKLEKNKRELDRQEKSVKKLGEVPCGDEFPTCKFIKDSYKDKKIINDQKETVQSSILALKDAKISLESVLSENAEKKIKKYDAMIKRQADLSVQISSLIVKHNNIENEIGQSKSSLSRECSILDDMSSHLVKDEENPASVIRSNIILLEDEIQRIDKKRLRLFEDVASLRVQISDMENKRKEFEKFKIDLKTYDLFMQAVSKKGIPLQIMMSQLPLINAEISRILQGVVGFTVELEADEDTNAMDVFINYGDSRRVIELASGMEKMMSSLAIRVALINVSSLTKTNMLIIDEGFGALDETNIESCSRLLESLKKWFRNIIIISHVDEIKDVVDNSLEITKNEKNAKVSHP